MTINELRARLAYWQAALSLPEWSVHLRWGTAREMTCEDGSQVVGLCFWSTEESSAMVLLARNQDDHESTLIHELLHLTLEGHRPICKKYDAQYERGLNRIADALKRTNKRNGTNLPALSEESD
jgi:hypothetical protein